MTMSIPTGTVLIVDDDRVLANAFALVLRRAGYQVRIAHDAEQALGDVERGRPDAIILDLRMAFINGLGFLYRLRSRDSHQIPVAVITGESTLSHDVEHEIRELGAEILFKPMDVDEVVAIPHDMVAHVAPRPAA
jgi:DNA-binding response OmpR family regulator